ncbi:hypothetical protein ACFVFI_04735 [Streptomyces sp. NPDC057705]|uniref:hypothetical protein n=1 Tax=Streptomyces sp. NPDC057705 TaxID=3346222 RepID=UPI0036CF75E1
MFEGTAAPAAFTPEAVRYRAGSAGAGFPDFHQSSICLRASVSPTVIREAAGLPVTRATVTGPRARSGTPSPPEEYSITMAFLPHRRAAQIFEPPALEALL